MNTLSTTLDLCSGICWSVVYVICIVQGVRHKTYGIPWPNICLNFSWEFWIVASRVKNNQMGSLPFAIQLVWLLLDVCVLLTWLCYPCVSFQKIVTKGIMLAAVVVLFYFAVYCTGQWLYSSFLINLLMSVLFCVRISKEDKKYWVSVPVAWTKMVGTLAATILNGVIVKNIFVLWIGGLCFIFDVWYMKQAKGTRQGRS